MREKIGSLIRQARQSRRMSLRDLSEATGVPPTTLHRIEMGTQTHFDLERLKAILDVLGVDLKDVFSESDYTPELLVEKIQYYSELLKESLVH